MPTTCRALCALALASLGLDATASVYRCGKPGSPPVFQSTPCANSSTDQNQYQPKGTALKRPAPSSAALADGDGTKPSTSASSPNPAADAAKRSSDQNARIDREAKIETKNSRIASLEHENQSLRAKMDRRISELRNEGEYANNNLAGATWQGSLASQMQAVTAQYGSQIQSNDARISALRGEVAALQAAGGQ